MSKDEKNVIGLMSGTSLDGLDIAHCTFNKNNNQYSYRLGECETIKYPHSLQDKLQSCIELKNNDLADLDKELGQFIGEVTRNFITEKKIQVDLICSHGHTVFHQPDKGITVQIGNGKIINEITQVTVINDFRSLDVSLGGQGAPLVPIGDKLLFSDYENCINLGGIANISLKKDGIRQAWDICPMNLVLNHLSQKVGQEFDRDGYLASTGEIIPSLLGKLNSLEYYKLPAPKSLGLEWIKEHVYPLIDNDLSIPDLIRTCVEHISFQISNSVEKGKVLFTGGGAHNIFLIELLKEKIDVVIPEKKIVDFKEALIFGFLGYLKFNEEINVLKSVTGAKRDSSSGVIIDLIEE